MARIVIVNLFEKTLDVHNLSKSLLQHFQDHRLDWLHSCGGKGRCTTCKLVIIHGKENFRPLTIAEEKYRHEGALSDSERLSCQAKIMGDITIAVPEEYKLPQIQYSDDM